jgi:hypothetical protein
MKRLIALFLLIFVSLPVPAQTPKGFFRKAVNQCLSLLGIQETAAPDQYSIDFKIVLDGAKWLRNKQLLGLNPELDHLDGLETLALEIANGLLANFAVEGLSKATNLKLLAQEITARVQSKTLTYAYLVTFPLRVNRVMSEGMATKKAEGDKPSMVALATALSFERYLKYAMEDGEKDRPERQLVGALTESPQFLLIPVLPGLLPDDKANQLIAQNVWPIGMARGRVHAAKKNWRPYELGFFGIHHGIRFAGFHHRAFWLKTFREILEELDTIEATHKLPAGTLHHYHFELFHDRNLEVRNLELGCNTSQKCWASELLHSLELNGFFSRMGKNLGGNSSGITNLQKRQAIAGLYVALVRQVLVKNLYEIIDQNK